MTMLQTTPEIAQSPVVESLPRLRSARELLEERAAEHEKDARALREWAAVVGDRRAEIVRDPLGSTRYVYVFDYSINFAPAVRAVIPSRGNPSPRSRDLARRTPGERWQEARPRTRHDPSEYEQTVFHGEFEVVERIDMCTYLLVEVLDGH